MTRKLVTLRQIAAIDPIPNADAIEVATVDGWKVVVKKGEYSIGQRVVYFEIDSVLPKGREEFEFLMARGCKEHHCDDDTYLLGHRLRTIKLRGQVSQGLVIPIPGDWTLGLRAVLPDYQTFEFDEDLSEVFGVKKYEQVIPACLAGQQRGNYPRWLPKTDQERVQNCFNELDLTVNWTIEEKIEGSSMTVYHDGETVGVTSRNLDLVLEQEGNTFVDMATNSGLLRALDEVVKVYPHLAPIAIRGELVGPGIQDNIYQLSKHRFYIFDVYTAGRYLTFEEREGFLGFLMGFAPDVAWDDMIFQVPVIQTAAKFVEGVTVDDIVNMANGESLIHPTKREGLVFKMAETHGKRMVSFKAISPEYLLSEA